MRLVPFNDYVVRAEKFAAENPLGTWKRAFLSTEDVSSLIILHHL
jgi:hypothetical protein